MSMTAMYPKSVSRAEYSTLSLQDKIQAVDADTYNKQLDAIFETLPKNEESLELMSDVYNQSNKNKFVAPRFIKYKNLINKQIEKNRKVIVNLRQDLDSNNAAISEYIAEIADEIIADPNADLALKQYAEGVSRDAHEEALDARENLVDQIDNIVENSLGNVVDLFDENTKQLVVTGLNDETIIAEFKDIEHAIQQEHNTDQYMVTVAWVVTREYDDGSSKKFLITDFASKNQDQIRANDYQLLISMIDIAREKITDYYLYSKVMKTEGQLVIVNPVIPTQNLVNFDQQQIENEIPTGLVLGNSMDFNCLSEIIQSNTNYPDDYNKFLEENSSEIHDEYEYVEAQTGLKKHSRVSQLYSMINGRSHLSAAKMNMEFYHQSGLDLKNHGLIKKLKPMFKIGSKHKGNKLQKVAVAHNHAWELVNKKLLSKEAPRMVSYVDQIPFIGTFAKYKQSEHEGIHYAEKLLNTYENGKMMKFVHIYKTYNPSWYFGNTDETDNLSNINNAYQQAYMDICHKNNLKMSNNPLMTFLYRKSEKYIGTRVFNQELAEYAIDQKGSYSSYEFSEYYRGIPWGPGVLSKHLRENEKPSFYIIEQGEYPQLMPYLDIFNDRDISVMAYPLYEFFERIGIKLRCQGYIYHKLIDIKYQKFLDEYTKRIENLPEDIKAKMPSRKAIANSLIGYFIAGTGNDVYSYKYKYSGEYEKQAIIEYFNQIEKSITVERAIINEDDELEVIKKEKKPKIKILPGYIEILVPTSDIVTFHEIHSTITAFSHVAMIKEIMLIGKKNVHYVKVDAIGYSNSDRQYPDDCEPHKFKKEAVKKHAGGSTRSVKIPHSSFTIPNGMYTKDILVEELEILKKRGLVSYDKIEDPTRLYFAGPGGIGKTYNCAMIRKKHNLDMCLTAPTNNLVFSNKEFNGTTHKKFNLMSTKKLAKSCKTDIFVADEIFMHKRTDFNAMLENNNIQCLIICGDECQLKSIGRGITEDLILSKGFTKVTFLRPQNKEIAKMLRHDPDTGVLLDYFRKFVKNSANGTFIDDFSRILRKGGYGELSDLFDEDPNFENLDENCRVLTATNYQSYNINKIMKEKYINSGLSLFPCKLGKKTKDLPKGYRLFVPINSDEIWWDKMTMTDTIPAGKKYEPAYCTTVYSAQGTEFKKFIKDEDGNDTKTIQKVYIFKTKNDNQMYTAITRVQSLTQIRLLDDPFGRPPKKMTEEESVEGITED